MNDMQEGDVAETSNSNCADLMTAAYDYFSQLFSKIQTVESHKLNFHSSRTTEKQNTFGSRMRQFEHNVNKWGRKFDSYGCYCSPNVTAAIQNFANSVPARGTGKTSI